MDEQKDEQTYCVYSAGTVTVKGRGEKQTAAEAAFAETAAQAKTSVVTPPATKN